MVTCKAVREQLALNTTDKATREHIQTCSACAAYARRHNAIDGLARAEMHWQAPADLTARLLALALPEAVIMPRPKRWHVVLAYVFTTGSILFSLVVGWQLVMLLTTQVGLQAHLTELLALPAQWLTQLTQNLPESRYVVDFLLRARTQLVWLLLVALVWAVLDAWNPQLPRFRRRQRA